ncbi:MAG: hypothetical protein DSY47_07400 [Hydrogenothermus sp.]|nr:MAG: hypothetical protein DSY47_07400 [Hydrogenothermus sp.]
MVEIFLDWKSISKETGKAFLDIAVAFVIFALIQPFVKGELDTKLLLIAFFGFLINLTIGIFLIGIGGCKDDS